MVPWPVEDCANEAHYIKEKSLHAWLSLDPLANRLLQSAALSRPVCEREGRGDRGCVAAFEGILGLDEELSHATATAPTTTTTTTKAATTLLVTEVKNYYYEICKAGHAPGASPIVRNHHSRRRALLCCKGLSRVKCCGRVNARSVRILCIQVEILRDSFRANVCARIRR